MTPRPDTQVCPFHTDEVVAPVYIGSETVEWLFVCPLDGHPTPGPRSWPGPSVMPAAAPRVPAGLDRTESLVAAVRAASQEYGGGWVEYGLVERAWALANREDWSALLDKYDHRFYWPKGATAEELPYTASKYLAGRLGAVGRAGDVAFQLGKGTGYWDYLPEVSTWAPMDRAASPELMSFAQSGAQVTDYMPATRPKG